MKTTAKTFRIYLQTCLRFPRLFWSCVVLWPIGIALQDVIAQLIAARALNRLVSDSETIQSYPATFWPYVVGFLVVSGIGQVCIASGLVFLSKTETEGRQLLERQIYQHLLDQSLGFHNNTFAGSLTTQVNRFTGSYILLMDTLIIASLDLLVKFVVALAILAYYAPLIAGVMFIWTLGFMYVNYRMARKRTKISRQAASADSKITAHLADTISNITAVKAFARERTEFDSFDKLSRDRGTKKYAAWMHAVRTGVFSAISLILLSAIVLTLSVYGVAQGKIDVGTLVLAQIYLATLIAVLWGFSRITRNVEQAFSDAAEMADILEITPNIIDKARPKTLRLKHGAISFKNVSFTHDESDAELFTKLDLDIKAGEKIGFVGPSGSGKTTITRLLLRFLELDSGSIEIDGTSITDVAQAELRRNVAYVPQEPALFHRSLAENIAYGRPEANLQEIRDAARKAHAAEFIDQLQKGYDTLVGERGVKLSGGQRQRIAIARAMLKDAPILVLDEATSALDSESETLIQDALWKLMEGRTAIVIAHRLSTIQRMDRIVVLDNGRIVEQGTHKELLRAKGKYALLWQHQSGGFLED